jgi:hypothetical protein
MRKAHLIPIVLGVLALGLLAAGCGGDDETAATDTTAATTTTATEDTTAGETTGDTTETDSTTTDSGAGARAYDVYNACVDAIEGSAAEQVGQSACEQARDAFEQCTRQAEKAGGDAADTAIGICQQAADQAVKSLESSSGG